MDNEEEFAKLLTRYEAPREAVQILHLQREEQEHVIARLLQTWARRDEQQDSSTILMIKEREANIREWFTRWSSCQTATGKIPEV